MVRRGRGSMRETKGPRGTAVVAAVPGRRVSSKVARLQRRRFGRKEEWPFLATGRQNNRHADRDTDSD